MDTWLHLIHVLAAMVLVGGGLTLTLFGVHARSSPNPHAISEFGGTLSYLGLRLFAPAIVVLLISGVWMVLIEADWRFSQAWVLIGIGLFAVAALLGAIYLPRIGMKLERSLGRPQSEVRSLLDRYLTAYGVVVATLIVALWDMVFKPGA